MARVCVVAVSGGRDVWEGRETVVFGAVGRGAVLGWYRWVWAAGGQRVRSGLERLMCAMKGCPLTPCQDRTDGNCASDQRWSSIVIHNCWCNVIDSRSLLLGMCSSLHPVYYFLVVMLQDKQRAAVGASSVRGGLGAGGRRPGAVAVR